MGCRGCRRPLALCASASPAPPPDCCCRSWALARSTQGGFSKADNKDRLFKLTLRQLSELKAACGQSQATCVGSHGAFSVERVSRMDSILPGRLLALVRPGNDLVLRRIQSLKRCAQACGCKIMTPRYACNLAPGCISSEPTFAGLRKTQKKENKGFQKKRVPEKNGKGVSFGKA